MADPVLSGQSAVSSSLSALLPAVNDRSVLRLREALLSNERTISVQMQEILARPPRQRTKIWEFGTNLHCSIIGTCLSTAELRQVLVKAGMKECATASEHDVHASGVRVAGKNRDGAKLLHKALDRRHRVAINRFERAKSADEVRTLWQAAVRNGDIPGAYWAALTHPATDEGLVREIFTEVHMLSHLVGAANRADIRRLRQLELEKAELEEKVARQEQRLRDTIVTRDRTIRELSRALEERIVPDCHDGDQNNEGAWTALAADLKHRLARCDSRRERVERQFGEVRVALNAERNAREAAEQRETELRLELDALEASLARVDDDAPCVDAAGNLTGRTVLYVGGRPAQIGHLRILAERAGATFLHHDGGIEERGGLLAGLISRADAVLFPVDCISHAAMLLVKRLCGQCGKPFVPLRTSGLAPFCTALQHPALCGQEG
jgi:hypothetical protein